MFKLLWGQLGNIWEGKHFGYLLKRCIQDAWLPGIEALLNSEQGSQIFQSLNPQDKANLVLTKVFGSFRSRGGKVSESPVTAQLVVCLLE